MKLSNIKVDLQGKTVLDSVSLDISDGSLISLLGISGCGKTTLLKAIAGIVELSEGKIELNGEDISKVPANQRGIIMVFQDLRIFPHLSVANNIAFPMKIRGVKKSEQQRRVKELLSAVQLEGFENRRVNQMSGGQLQRVALARALAAEPRVLLLDEPFSGLDEHLRYQMGELVMKIHRETGISTILVTHDKMEALRMSDSIVLMDKGRILQADSPEKIYNFPNSRKTAEFFGKISYIDGRATGGVFSFEGLSMNCSLPDGKYSLAIRPSAVFVQEQDEKAIKTKISDVVYKGDNVELRLELKASHITASIPYVKWQKLNKAVSDEIFIKIDETQAMFFGQEEA